MTPPPNLDYDLCVYPADSASCSSLPAEGLCDGTGGSTNLGIFKSAGVAETYTSDTWMGGCFSNDDRDFIVQVVTFDSQNDFSCDPYKLEFTFSSN